MALDSFIRAAKTRAVRRVQDMALESIKYAPNPNRGMIIGDDKPRAVVQPLKQSPQGNGAVISNNSAYSSQSGIGSTSITGIAQAMSGPKTFAHEAGAEVSWQNCKCKVAAGTDRYLCRKFNIVCVKEKCPSKFIEV